MKTLGNIRQWLAVSIFAVLAAIISSQAQPSNCTPAPSGLVSWWRAEGNGLDSVGGNTAYAALLPGGVAFGPGEVGQAFQLNGTNAYLIVPASQTLNIGSGGGLTAEAWINLSNADGYHPILEWNNSARLGGVMLWVLPGRTLFANVVDTNQNSHSFASASGVISANVFQHVALTYDRSTGIGTLYLNGAIVAQENLGSFVPETTFNLWFGYRPGDVPGDATYGSYFGGLLDEVSLYNRALGSNEIAAVYNAGAAGKCDGTNSSSGSAPLITHQPTNQTVAAGDNVTFAVTVTGSPTLYYQWYGPSETLIPGANSSTLTLSNVQPSNAGSYYAFLTNFFGFAQSSNAVLTVTGGQTNSNTCTPPPTGLVGWWKGENNTLDSAGTNNGVVTLGSISYAPGEVGSAFHYDNSGGYVAVPPAPSLDVGQGSGFTLEAWIQPDDLENQLPIFEWEYNTNTDANGVHFWISSIGGAGCLFANIVDSNFNSHWIYSAPGLITADYQHVALTYNKSSGLASIYRNGVLVVSENLGSFTPNTTGNLLLGERTYLSNEPQFHYVGGLDEMSVYNRALSQSEIAAIYKAGSAGKCGGGTTNSSRAPVITQQPTNQTIIAGSPATFTVKATGTGPLYYQWYTPAGRTPVVTTTPTLTLLNAQPGNSGSYFVVVTNSFGSVQSSNAILTVLGTRPAIPHQPTNETVTAGGTAFFSVTSLGTLPLHFQWFGPGEAAIQGANASTLVLSNVQPAQAGAYFVLVTNQYGFAVSSNAVLTVTGGGGGTNSCTPAPSGITAWWPAEGNGNDILGHNNAIVESGVTFAPGKVGRAFSLTNYTNGFMHVPASPSLNIGAIGSGITMEGWINVASVDGLHPIAEWYSGVRDILGVQFWINSSPFESGGLLAVLYDTNGYRQALTSPQGILQPNVFQHVAMTYDRTSGMTTIYLNGAAVAQANMGSFVPQTSYNLWIGHRPFDVPGDWTYGATLGGLLDEFTLYNRALSSNEIASIYNAGANGKCAPTNSGTGIAPVITGQPTNRTVSAGANVTFTVSATGSQPLHYEWYGPDNLGIPGADTSTLTLSNVQPSQAGSYYAFVTNSFGFAQSSNAVLTINGGTNSNLAPVITRQPTNQTVAIGGTATFSVVASGTPTVALHFQWYGPDSTLIPGAINSILTLSNVQPSAAGEYFVLVTNHFGFVISSNATLTVTGGGIGGGTNSCTPAPSGIAAWWPAEGSGVDIIGGATATLHGGATFAPGEVGQAFRLDGIDDYLTASSSNLNVAAGGSFTVEAWIKVSDVTDYHPIVEWNDNSTHVGVHLWILPYTGETPGVLFANVVDTGGGSHAFHSPGGSVSTNGFQHVALTYDQSSGIATLYANSNIVAQTTLGSFAPQTSYELWMGRRPNDVPENATYGAHLGGLLDELSLYRRVLSQSEIGAIYNAGANGKCTPSPTVPHSTINPQPTMKVSAMGNTPVLSWPVSAAGFMLQSADSLTPPIHWTNVPATLQTNGDNIEATLPTGGQRGYFRLNHP